MRQVVLDTETTGIDISAGNRLIEIGCVELVNRKLTGRTYHQYIHPERDIEEGAYQVHGIDLDFLQGKPLFHQIVDEFLSFVDGAELIIHNAPFDIGFLNHELQLLDKKRALMDSYCTVLDTLKMAKAKHPGQRNSLDALCKRYGVDNTNRTLHGALLDSELLAEVYLLLTGGQTGLFQEEMPGTVESKSSVVTTGIVIDQPLTVLTASEEEIQAHKAYLDFLEGKSGDNCIWLK